MASELDLFNDALGQLGHTRIDTLDDDNDQLVQVIKTFRHTLRRSTLQDHNWNFATRWTELAQDTATPPAKWAYQYTVPADALRVWRIDECDSTSWEIILGADSIKKLATDQTTVTAEITYDVTNPDQWSGMFYQALAAGYAWKLAGPIIGGPEGRQIAEQKRQDFFNLLLEAKAIDGQEQSPQRLLHTEFVTCRG